MRLWKLLGSGLLLLGLLDACPFVSSIIPVFAQVVECEIASPVEMGDTARVTPGLSNRLRQAPGFGKKKIDLVPENTEFVVLSDPVCEDETYWIELEFNGRRGWTAIGDTEYWIVKVNPEAEGEECDILPPVEKGDLARITPGDSNVMRRVPGKKAKKLGDIPAETEFLIEDDPFCQDGDYWVKLSFDGKTGWTIIADRKYWIVKLQLAG